MADRLCAIYFVSHRFIMIPFNSREIKDEEAAELIAKATHNPTKTRSEFALQLFIEELVLPKNCKSYTEDDLKCHLLEFMKKHDSNGG